MQRATGLTIAAAIAGALAIPFAFGGSDALSKLGALPLPVIAGIAAFIVVSWLAKALKFWFLATRLQQRASFRTCAAVSLGCDLGFLATPAGLGGYAASIYLFGRCGIGAAGAAAITTADQVLDLVFFAIAVPFALLFTVGSSISWIQSSESIMTVVVAIALGAIVLRFARSGLWRRVLIAVLTMPLVRRHQRSLRRWWIDLESHLRDLLSMPPQLVAAVLLATLLQWCARYAILGLALAGLGSPAPFAPVFLIQAVALHAGQWTGVPAGVGGTDILMLQLLRPWGTTELLAVAVLVWRLATFHVTLLAGSMAVAFVLAQRTPDKTMRRSDPRRQCTGNVQTGLVDH
jgi:uncharacterized protein (TIRG00374 family)